MLGYRPIPFPRQVIDDLRTDPLCRITVAPGRGLETSIGELMEATYECGQLPVRIDLHCIFTLKDFFNSLSESLSFDEKAGNFNDFLRQITGWFQTRVVILVGNLEVQLIPELMESARAVADATRDLENPCRFLWIHDSLRAKEYEDLPFKLWPGQWADIPLLEFNDRFEDVLHRAMRLYIDRRIHWESAGQVSRIETFLRRVDDRASQFKTISDVDRSLDVIFDAEKMPDDESRAMLDLLGDPAQFDRWTKALSQELFPVTESKYIRIYNAVGIIWRPPGNSKWRLTSACVKSLFDQPAHPLSVAMGMTPLRSRLMLARANPLLSQMALVLTTQIEMELLEALRRFQGWERYVEESGIGNDLRKLQRRAESKLGIPLRNNSSLLDFATFGQLIRLSEEIGPGFRFQISKSTLWEIAEVRNMAAHGQPINWSDLHRAVVAIHQLIS